MPPSMPASEPAKWRERAGQVLATCAMALLTLATAFLFLAAAISRRFAVVIGLVYLAAGLTALAGALALTRKERLRAALEIVQLSAMLSGVSILLGFAKAWLEHRGPLPHRALPFVVGAAAMALPGLISILLRLRRPRPLPPC